MIFDLCSECGGAKWPEETRCYSCRECDRQMKELRELAR